MLYTVVFTPEAEAQLVELYGYIAEKAFPEIAARFNPERLNRVPAATDYVFDAVLHTTNSLNKLPFFPTKGHLARRR